MHLFIFIYVYLPAAKLKLLNWRALAFEEFAANWLGLELDLGRADVVSELGNGKSDFSAVGS